MQTSCKWRKNDLVINRAKTATFGEKSLITLGPKIWHSLPEDVKYILNLSSKIYRITVKPVSTTTFLKRPPVLNDHVVVLPQVFRSNFSLCSGHLYNVTNEHLNDVPGFLLPTYITTISQSAYPGSHNKFSRYFCFKVIYNMLFYHNIVFCFEQKYTPIYFCQYQVKSNASFKQRPNITFLAIIHAQVFFITTTCL